MRKLLTVLALVLTVALCASFAASATTLTTLTSTSTDVSVNYAEIAIDKTTVYSVDVTWSDVSFAYSAGSTKWNPEDHEYNSDDENGSWTDSTGSVKVTNHSNAAVKVDVTYNQASTANGTAKVTVSNGSFSLSSADGVSYADAATKTATLTASGVPTSNANLGTVKVTISAAN